MKKLPNDFIYLASKSPRRQELLNQIGILFDLVDIDVEETPQDNETALEYVRRLAIEKSQAGLANCDGQAPVLGADTIVVLNQRIMEKPSDKDNAVEMLLALSGSTHQVMTAIALSTKEQILSDVVITNVTFGQISEQQAIAYWYTGEPADKAGGYGIQGLAGKFVEKIEGSYFAVVGLPLYETQLLINRAFNKER